MAGAGAKLFTSGSVLTADQVNTYLMDQAIMKFASTTARDAAFGGAGEPTLAEGMFAYTTDTNTLWLYDGSSWVAVLGSDIGAISTDNRNVIINGAMQVAQRGTSTASITTSGYYTVDRFRSTVETLGTWTQTVENDGPTGSGLTKSLKMLCTTADAAPAAVDRIFLNQIIEGQNVQQFAKGTASAKTFNLTFWVKSNVTGTYIAELFDLDNTRQVSAAYTISASGTWEKKVITFPADVTGIFDNNSDGSLFVDFWLAAGSNSASGTLNTTWGASVAANRAAGQVNLAAATDNYWQVTGVQLEVGAVATPFEFEDFGTTLAKCQRYYWRSTAGSVFQSFGVGTAQSTTVAQINVKNPVDMRVAPTAIETSTIGITDSVNVFAVTGVSLAFPGIFGSSVSFTCSGGGLTQYRTSLLCANNSTSAYVALSAEL
jgi:hypothetical protein